MPVRNPGFAVIEVATRVCCGVFDSELDALASLAFSRLSRDEVEIVADAPALLSCAAWS